MTYFKYFETWKIFWNKNKNFNQTFGKTEMTAVKSLGPWISNKANIHAKCQSRKIQGLVPPSKQPLNWKRIKSTILEHRNMIGHL